MHNLVDICINQGKLIGYLFEEEPKVLETFLMEGRSVMRLNIHGKDEVMGNRN